MTFLDNLTRSFMWRPAGCAGSLADPGLAPALTAKWEVTAALTGQAQSRHPLTVVELAGGKVVGDLRLVATRQDVVIGGLQSIFGCAEPQSHYLLKRRRLRLPKYRQGTALLLGTNNGDNYYHWLLENLPRWKMWQAAQLPPVDFVLLPAQPTRFQEETLDRLQVPGVRLLRCAKHLVHQFERLVVPAMPFPMEEVAPWACAWVRSLFPGKSSGPEKLYLSRGAGRRRLVNEPELEQALVAQGFSVVHTGQMSVAEQAVLFGSARCVVAPHGAALTNLIFAPPGTALVELFHPQHKNLCYINLAAACGHRYASLDGRPVNRPGDDGLAYAIDIGAVIETLKRELGRDLCPNQET